MHQPFLDLYLLSFNKMRVVALRLKRAPDSSYDVSDQQSVGSSPDHGD